MNRVFSPIYLPFINPDCFSDIKLSMVDLILEQIHFDIISKNTFKRVIGRHFFKNCLGLSPLGKHKQYQVFVKLGAPCAQKYIELLITCKYLCNSKITWKTQQWTHHYQASGPPTLRLSQIWDFSENLSFSHQTVPPNKCFLKFKLSCEFFLHSEIFLKRACHQHFFSLTWGIKAGIFQKMLRLANSNLK